MTTFLLKALADHVKTTLDADSGERIDVSGAFSQAAKLELKRDRVLLMPLEDRSRPSTVMDLVRQPSDFGFGVLYRVRNRRDDLAGLVEIEALRKRVFAALLGWPDTADAVPDTDPEVFGVVEHRRGRVQLPESDREQCWLDQFTVSVIRTQEA
ncbi:MAG: hypothetical protein F4X59_17435 [Holophagales bacterium]|nr:hypothetical protein [Holophagales bacterium]MYC11889.1 hypothetical protein [Holophagales bacterium]